MQNRYVGDVGDFAKYYLLRRLSSSGTFDPPLSLGIVWYLVPDDHDHHDQDDGRYIGYLGLTRDGDNFINAPDERTDNPLRKLDPELFSELRHLLLANTRNVAAVMKKSIFPDTTKAYDAFPGGEGGALPPHQFRQRQERRAAWCNQILSDTNHHISEANHDIIFLDPDNGISLPGYGINSRVAGGQRNAVKYVLQEELTKFFNWASVALVVYHHLGRQFTHDVQVRMLVLAVTQHLGDQVLSVTAIRCNRGSGRVYLVIQKKCGRDLAPVLGDIQNAFVLHGLWRGSETAKGS